METVIRAAAIYLFLLLVFRLSGKRVLSKMTPFDLVLLLIVGEAASQGLIGDDYSISNAMLLIGTLVLIELALAVLKQRSKRAERIIDDMPLILVKDGKPLRERMDKERVDVSDVLEAARKTRGLAELGDIHLAVLERDGSLSIIPAPSAGRST
jgi:uncharacterized membrane protein YcaP (DUF421 family)